MPSNRLRNRMQFQVIMTAAIAVAFVSGCATLHVDEFPLPNEALPIMTTADGVDFVRTPDIYFENLPDWPYDPKYVEINGLRQAYVDVGPADTDPILLLHGQPSWSYLYRYMIPVLAEAGHRVTSRAGAAEYRQRRVLRRARRPAWPPHALLERRRAHVRGLRHRFRGRGHGARTRRDAVGQRRRPVRACVRGDRPGVVPQPASLRGVARDRRRAGAEPDG